MRVAFVLLLACLSASAQTVVIYARVDAEQARRAYVLTGALTPVWMDTEILAGRPWRTEISKRICSAENVLVMWSAAAASSAEVTRELTLAQACGIRTVPVVLDSTPLPSALSASQWVDWRP